MFRFAKIEYLNLLWLVPVLLGILWFFLRTQGKQLNKFAGKPLHKVLFPYRSLGKQIVKGVLGLLALVSLAFAIANPQIGSKVEEVKQQGIDVFILLDVSKSMMAEDIKPSRLEKAKFEIKKLINKLRGDRIGLIVFSGDAYIQFPLTTDYAAANLFLSAVDVNSVPQPGTAVGPAISLALQSFKMEDDTKKAIVVITDGEDHEGEYTAVLQNAAEQGVVTYAIGLGSPKGVPIPVYNESGKMTGYKKDRSGKVVLTKLGEETLAKVAQAGGGKYYRATNTSNELDKIYGDLSQIEETEYGTTKVTDYEDRFYWFLIPAILLVLFEVLVNNKKSKIFMKLEEN